MIRKNLLIVPLLFCSSFLMAQSSTEVADFKVGKYTVKTITNADETYGYEIYESGKLVLKQKEKTYTEKKAGFRDRQNATTVGIWLANELNEGRRPKTIDLQKAKELGLSKADL